MARLSEVIPNRVRALRQERGWSLAELAERANTTAPQIMKLERSHRRLNLEWIERLADAFQVSAQALMTDDAQSLALRLVPIVGDIAAGNWREAIQLHQESVPVPAELAGGPDAFALRPRGDSMNLVVPEDGYVIVDPSDADLRDGKIYAVMNGDGETTVKRYRADPSRLEPCSTNSEHQPIMIGRAPFTVIGRVVSTFAPL